MSKSKLFVPKWKLWLKKAKYWLFIARPIPLLKRKKCPKCKINWNPELFRGCPMCGQGPNRIFLVIQDHTVKGIYRDPDDAKYAKEYLENELDSKATIETWDIQ